MLVEVLVIEPHDGKHPGERYNTSERTARILEGRGLVRIGIENKMLQPAKENKQMPHPIETAGEDVKSSASPAVQVSPVTTATPSTTGRRRGRSPGRRSR